MTTGPTTAADPTTADPAPPPLPVRVRRLDPDVPLPRYAMPGDAGADLVTTVDCRLEPGQRAVVPTGIAIALPFGYAAFVHPRSGLAARVGLSIVNTPGTIDAGYRGELKLVLINHDPRSAIELRRYERVAQLVIQKVEYATFVEVDDLDATDRGHGGYGSTGGSDALRLQRSESLGHLG
ncbi:dUTP diphosphatase [Nakamurella sp. A5-74]|uniref:Deoxyuridine 5'-triphosphate nucleotidohydrolase n=1 Tax=Nakamurella sp. A5-74 TaxID=3158264 RepID=A0AAU8DUZ7_9ACTN